MKRQFKIIIFTFIFCFIYACSSFALSGITHGVINEHIVTNLQNRFDLDKYLNDQLDFTEGKDQKIKGHEIYKWIRKGGLYEDEPPWTLPYIRSANHFHNPLVSLDNAGFSGVWGTGFLRGESAMRWAQKTAEAQSPGGNYSWLDVRDYYLNGLRASNKTIRDYYLVETFRGLGQLMHLVQDMSVPEHAREGLL